MSVPPRLLVLGAVGLAVGAALPMTQSAIAAPHGQRAQRNALSPSGLAMPGNFVQWRQTLSDDFTGTSLSRSTWTIYNGPSKSYAASTWTPANVVVSGGVLHLLTRSDGHASTSAGISSAIEGGQSYGKWTVRVRTPKADGVTVAVGLYPEGGGWPPEVDFDENAGGDRDHALGTLHYLPNNTQVHSVLTGVDLSQWHTLGVILRPGQVQYTIDGRVWATTDSAGVPSQKMWLFIQTGISNCTSTPGSCVDASTPAVVDTQVDWVTRYAAK